MVTLQLTILPRILKYSRHTIGILLFAAGSVVFAAWVLLMVSALAAYGSGVAMRHLWGWIQSQRYRIPRPLIHPAASLSDPVLFEADPVEAPVLDPDPLPTEDPQPGSLDLASLTIRELKAMATGKGIRRYWLLNKSELIAALG